MILLYLVMLLPFITTYLVFFTEFSLLRLISIILTSGIVIIGWFFASSVIDKIGEDTDEL